MMPDQINQTLGFNATQAIQTLRELDGVMASFDKHVRNTVNALTGFNRVGGKTVSALKHMKTDAKSAAKEMKAVFTAAQKGTGFTGAGKVVSDLNKVNQAATAAGTAVRNSAKDAKKGAKSWLISWETMGRVVFTQAIVRGLNIIRQSLKAAVRDAVDFQRAIGEIETIGREMGGFENISNVVRRISDEFNVELGDTAEAVYQVISNQIAQSAEAVEQFTGSAAKFSKITKTDLATSVNLLSGTLNAFGKTVADTEDVAAKFFKTIELGRVRAEELEHGYGTVAPTAEKLGIAFEEVNAALATLTIQGIQTDKAFTQIRGMMQSFLKPTKEMEAAMRELGFANAAQILEAYDLQEALRAVIGTTDGNAESVAKLIPRIRGLTGGLGLAGDEAEHFTKAIKEQETALEDAYDKAYEIVITTDAERITKELNKVKNFFTDEFGEAVLKSAIDMSELLGGAENLLLVFETMAAVIPGVVVSLAALGTVMLVVKAQSFLAAGGLTAAATAATRLQIALGGIGLAAVAITAIILAFKKVEQARAQEVASALAANDAKLASTQERIAKELRAEKAKLAEMTKLHAQEMAKFRKVYLEKVEIIKDESDAMVSNTKWALDTILSASRAAVDAIGKASSGLGKSIEASRTSVRGLKSDLDALLFERKVKGAGSEQEQFRLLSTAAAKASKEAVDLMAQATTEQDRKAAMAAHKQAIAFNDQAYALDLVTKSRSKQNSVNAAARVMTNDLVRAEEKYQRLQEEEKKVLATQARDATSKMALREAEAKQILELVDLYDEKGQPLDAATVKANRIKVQKEISELLVNLKKDAETLGLEGSDITKKFFDKLALDMESVEVQTLLATPNNMSEVYAKVAAALEELAKANPIQLEIELYAKMMDLPIGSLAEMEAVERAMGSTALKAEEMQKALETTSAQIVAAQEDAAAASAKMQLEKPATVTAGMETIIQPLTEVQKTYNAIVLEMRAMASSGEVNIDLLNALVDQAQILRNSLGWLEADPFSKSAVAFQEMANALGLMANLANVSERDNLLIADTDEARRLRDVLPIVEERNRKLAEGTTEVQKGQSAQAVQTAAVLTTNAAVETTISSYQRMTGAIRNAAAAQSSMASSAKPAGNGVITNPYFAAGGVARGTDTQMAMLSAGERVTDAKNSRRFFSQLQAIGAGQQPVYRNAGGDTYNTNVGGINIHDKTGQPQQTAREVMRAIKREQRRGSGRI